MSSNQMGGSNLGDDNNNAPRLTEHQLELSISMEYQFEDLGGDKNAVKEIIVAPVPLEQMLAAQADEADEDSEEEEKKEEVDDEEFNLFYDRDEIESTKEQQVYDAFEDIKEIREDYIMSGIAGNKALNKININDYAPKHGDLQIYSKKNTYGPKKSIKGSTDGDELFDLKEKLDLDVDEALEAQKKIESGREMFLNHAKEQ